MVISLGGGILLGLALMVWGLVERSKRAKVEGDLNTARSTNTELRAGLAKSNAIIGDLSAERARFADQIKVLRATVDVLRDKLRDCRDPSTVRAWLDEELGKQV
jgi:septal ring factor EnvC (AmiA/AmiB activator)